MAVTNPDTTLTGKLVDASGNPLVGGTMTVQLCNYGSAVPTVAQTGVIAQTSISPTIDGTGSYNFTLYGNDQITPAGTFYTVVVKDANNNVIQCQAYRFTGTQTSDLANLSPYNPAPAPVPGNPPWVQVIPSGQSAVVLPAIPYGYVIYQLLLTATVLNSSIAGYYPGQIVGIELTQDSVGGHFFNLPPNAASTLIVNGYPGSSTFFLFVQQTDGTLFSLQGPTGATGTLAIGTTTTSAPGGPAQVTNTGTPTAGVFNFTIPQGVIGPVGPPTSFSGTYNSGQTYQAGNYVSYTDGSSYVCLVNGTTNIPPTSGTSNANWAPLALAGALSGTVTTPLLAQKGATVTGGAKVDSLRVVVVYLGTETVDIQNPSATTYFPLYTDAAGRVAIALAKNGQARLLTGAFIQNGAQIDALTVLNMATIGSVLELPLPAGQTTFVDGITDSGGNVSLGILPDGTCEIGAAKITGQLRLNGGTSDNNQLALSASLPLDLLSLSSAATTNLTRASLNCWLTIGQSLANAYVSTPLLNTVQLFNNLMLNGGVRQGPNNAQAPASGMTSLVPQVQALSSLPEGETITSSASTYLSCEQMKFANNTPNAAAVCAWDGNPYSNMAKGSQTYSNAIAVMTAFKALSSGAIPRGIWVVHGETDDNNRNQSYGANLVTWQANYNADINTAMGTNVVIPFYLSQPNSFGDYGSTSWTTALVDLLMLQTVETYPTLFRAVCPKYFLAHVDQTANPNIGNGVHLTNVGEVILGEYYAKASICDMLAPDMAPWTGLRPIPETIKLSGRSIVINFYVPVGPLQIDVVNVTEPHNFAGSKYGFEFDDGSGAPPAITDLQIIGSNSVKLTLAAAPLTTGTMYLSYAYTSVLGQGTGPTMGARGNLRDSDTRPSRYDGRPLYNWCWGFRKVVSL